MNETQNTLEAMSLTASSCVPVDLDLAGNGMTIYDKITKTIVACLEQGVRPWIKPWTASAAGPHNIVTKHRYTGINVPLLWATQMLSGYTSDAWVTAHWLFTEGKERGVRLRRKPEAPEKGATGQKAALVVYYGTAKDRKEETAAAPEEGEDRVYRFLKGTNVFNLDQLDGVPDEWIEKITDRTNLEAPALGRIFIERCNADIVIGGSRACYVPLTDRIHMPHYSRFVDKVGMDKATAAYVSTTFHELVHWTGASSRLKRFDGVPGHKEYAYEELIAEMGSAFLSAEFGLDPVIASAAYLDGWLRAFRKDIKVLLKAAGSAQKAVEYLHGLQQKETA